MATATRKPKPDPAAVLPEFLDLRVALARLLAGKKEAGELPPGKRAVRGVATIAVDCWLEKAEATDSRAPWPTADVLALALHLALGDDHDRLRQTLVLAADRLFGRVDGAAACPAVAKNLEEANLVFIQQVGRIMDRVKQEFIDLADAGKLKLPRLPRTGVTEVTGTALVVKWKEQK